MSKPKKATKRTAPRTPREKKDKAAATSPAPKAPRTPKTPATRDPRLPAAGSVIERTFKSKTYRVEVLDRGFKFDGREWRSLTAIAKEITRAPAISGPRFFGIAEPAPAKATTATAAKPPSGDAADHPNERATPAGQRAAIAAAGIGTRRKAAPKKGSK